MAAPPEHGRLEETSLPRLLVDLHRARFSGSLELSRDRVAKTLLLQQGVPVFAESNLASESLGVQLMDRGEISRDDYSAVVDYVREHRCKEGMALLDLDLIDPKRLFLALKDQVRMRVVECFGWARGEYALDASQAPPEDAQPFRADLYALLQEGIETHWSPERTIADLSERMGSYPTPNDRFARVRARLRSDDAVEAFAERLDGSHTLWKALQEARTPRALAAAWVLDAAGGLTYRDAARDEAGRAPEPAREVEIVVAGSEPAAPQVPRRAPRAAAGRRPRGTSRKSKKLRREIAARFEQLADLDFYQVLGLDPQANAAAIKRAYLVAAKTYHPDALARAGLDAEVRQQANQVFAKITKAYAVISDPRRRREYDESLGVDETALDANRIATAESLYRKGDILLRAGNFRGALEFLKPCVDLWPDEAVYRSSLGWALYKQPASQPEEACEHLEAATRLDPADGVAWFRLSVVLRAVGDAQASSAARARAEGLGHGSST